MTGWGGKGWVTIAESPCWRGGARYVTAWSNVIAPMKAGGGKASCRAQRSSDRGDAGKPAPRCVAACASRALTAISAVAAPCPH